MIPSRTTSYSQVNAMGLKVTGLISSGQVAVYNIDPTEPMGSWKSAWTTCRRAAGVWCGLHDLRHTFMSVLAEEGVTESTLKVLAGWMLRKMLECYSHSSNKAKHEAVNKLPRHRPKSA